MLTFVLVCMALAAGWYAKQMALTINRPKEIKALNEQLYKVQLNLFTNQQELKMAHKIIADLYIENATKHDPEWTPHNGQRTSELDGNTVTAETNFKSIIDNYFNTVLRAHEGYEENMRQVIESFGAEDARKIIVGTAFKDFVLMSEYERALPCKTTRTERLIMYTLLVERFFDTLTNQKPAA